MVPVSKFSVGKHDFPAKIKEYGLSARVLHEDVLEVGVWVERVCEFAKKNDRSGYPQKKILGDAFEHLIQCAIELRAHDTIKVNCRDVGVVADNEPGVDLIGNTHDGNPHAHQCKFSATTSRQLSMTTDRISRFPSACHKYGPNVSMTLWTTAKRISPQAEKDFGASVNVFGYKQICDLLDGDEYFWETLYAKSLGATPKPRIGRLDNQHENPIKPHDYQEEALLAFQNKMKADGTQKGRFVYPTGSGKTLIESLILNYQIDRIKKPSVHVVVAPRIALVNQLMREFRTYIGDKYRHIGFHTGDSEVEGDILDDGWMRRKQKNTVDTCEVKFELKRARQENKHMVIFSTYHSLWKIVDSGIRFETMIADESQYCISRNYFVQIQKIRAKAKLYFTATERHNSIGERSNDNKRVFGKVLGSQTIKELVKRKILTEPRLHLMYGKKKKVNLDSLVAEAEHISTEQREMVNSKLPSKTLFACKKARNVETIIDHMNKLKNAVPDHTIFTIISNPKYRAMVDGMRVSRNEFMKQLDQCTGNAIIFHYDILSEGIDIDGITGVAILRNMGQAKMLQTIGRCLRPFKASPKLKKHSHVSVPIIDEDVQNSNEVRNVIKQMLLGGHEINVEHVKISDILPKPDPYRRKKKKGKDSDPESNQPELELGGRVEQTELEKVKHKIEVIRQSTAKLVKAVEKDLEEEYIEDMYGREITSELISDIFAGVYQSAEVPSNDQPLPIAKKLNPVLESSNCRYRIIKEAWSAGVMEESLEKVKGKRKGKAMRPLTPHWMIEDHLDKVGDVSNKSVLTFNVEHVPYLRERGAVVTVATKGYCPYTRKLVESQVVDATYQTMDAIMKSAAPPPSKFDIVIGNPPYQERKPEHKKTRMIWQDFVLDAIKLLKRGGILAMIHPPAWRGTGNTTPSEIKVAREMLKSMDMEYLSMTSKKDCGKFFKGYTTPFDMYVARKSNTPGFQTQIRGINGVPFRSCIKDMKFIPNMQCRDLEKILAKEGEERVDFLYERTYYGTDKDNMHDVDNEKVGEFKHPCVYMISRDENMRRKNGGQLTLRYSNEIKRHKKLKNPSFLELQK